MSGLEAAVTGLPLKSHIAAIVPIAVVKLLYWIAKAHNSEIASQIDSRADDDWVELR